MRQFLRLMFDPVAGRMVRTLFLDKLRAERELAPTDGTRIERLVVGAVGAGLKDWTQALAAAKVPQTVDGSLPSATVELVDAKGKHHRVALRMLDQSLEDASYPVAVLSPSGPYGRVIEIVGAADDAAAALAALASRLRCLPWRTPGPESILQKMRNVSLEEQARIARQYVDSGGAGDPAFLDVAACLAGVAPAWSGGPLAWSSDQGPRA
jgi:3-hydroxyacyl-CoA dehydrogenase/enoyl-CoA hydratase/3-hydroxybutyryl-CoA epimerase